MKGDQELLEKRVEKGVEGFQVGGLVELEGRSNGSMKVAVFALFS